jgi:transcriptional regulator with XRE-family HTH domain
MTSVGARLRAERKRLNKTQDEFCALGGVSKNTQGNYEKEPGEIGYTSPTVDYLLRLGAADVNLHYIVFGSYSNEGADQKIAELIVLLMQMSPAQQAISFSILTMFQQTAASGTLETASELWRGVRLFGQFFKMDQAGRELVEYVAANALLAAKTMK